MQRKNEKATLKLYDIDGCLFHKFNKSGRDDENISTWLIESNKAFLESEVEEMITKTYDMVIVAHGTNRQCKISDATNSYRGGSCTPALPIIQAHYQNQLQSKSTVVFDPFWLADIYKNKSIAGTSYKAALKAHQLKLVETVMYYAITEWIFDHSKNTILYAYTHRTAVLNPNLKVLDVDFVDDKNDILQDNYDFYCNYPQLLPSHVTLRLYHYDGGKKVQYQSAIQGTGIVDPHYEWSVRFMSSMSYYFNSGAAEDRDIDTADQLRKYHEDDHYHAPGHKMEMGNYGFKIDRFLKMREEEIPKLADRSTLGKDSNYTTAEALAQETGATIVLPQDKRSVKVEISSSSAFEEKQELPKKSNPDEISLVKSNKPSGEKVGPDSLTTDAEQDESISKDIPTPPTPVVTVESKSEDEIMLSKMDELHKRSRYNLFPYDLDPNSKNKEAYGDLPTFRFK